MKLELPSLMAKANRVFAELVESNKMDLVFGLIKCLRPLDPRNMFMSVLTEKYTRIPVTSKTDAFRRYELGNDLSEEKRLTKQASESLINILELTPNDYNDELFKKQAKIIEKIEQHSFTGTRDHLFSALGNMKFNENHDDGKIKVIADFNENTKTEPPVDSLVVIDKPNQSFWKQETTTSAKKRTISDQSIIIAGGKQEDNSSSSVSDATRYKRQISFEVLPMEFLIENKESPTAGSAIELELCPRGCGSISGTLVIDIKLNTPILSMRILPKWYDVESVSSEGGKKWLIRIPLSVDIMIAYSQKERSDVLKSVNQERFTRRLKTKLIPDDPTYLTIKRQPDPRIKSMIIALRFSGKIDRKNKYRLPLLVDTKEPDCSSTGPYHKINKCKIGKMASYKLTHCLCLGNPQEPILVQSTFFAIPKMSDVEWNEFLDGILRNPTPLYWTLFFTFILFVGFIIGRKYEKKSPSRNKFRVCDSCLPTDICHYILTVYVHYFPWSGTRNKITVQLYGTKGVSRQFCLQNNRDYIFERGMVLSFCLTTNQSIGRIKKINMWINPNSDFGEIEDDPSILPVPKIVSDSITQVQSKIKEWMGIDQEDRLRLSHISVVSMQSKNIFYFPCDYGRNKNIYLPQIDVPQPLYSYSPSLLGSFDHVFTNAFFGHFFAHNVCLAPFHGTDWSEPVPDRVLLAISVIIASSLLNMLMNETEGRTQMLRVGKDTIDITWFIVIIQSELFVFLFEAWVLSFILETFCRKEIYRIWHKTFPDVDDELSESSRRLIGYSIIFGINIYFCLIVCIHGSQLDNESIEDWESEVIWEIILAALIIDPMICFIATVKLTIQAIVKHKAPLSLWVPFELNLCKKLEHDWIYFSEEIEDLSKTFSAFKRINAKVEIDDDDYDGYYASHPIPKWRKVLTWLWGIFTNSLVPYILTAMIIFTLDSFALNRLDVKRFAPDPSIAVNTCNSEI